MEGCLWNFRPPLSRLNTTIPTINSQQTKLPELDPYKTRSLKEVGVGIIGLYHLPLKYWLLIDPGIWVTILFSCIPISEILAIDRLWDMHNHTV